jgi:Copper transport outer membrane protein, MctB
MIDFRYHLVSLVSVFLALAVGIVLGAGPLKDPISEGLSQSVQQLRQDRDALGDQLKTAQAGSRNRDTFIGEVQGQLVANQLSGRSVVLVTLPGADADAVRPLTAALTDAGARMTGRIDLRDAWADPASRSARDTAIANLRSIAGGGAGSSRSPSPSPSPSPSASGITGSAADTAAAQVLARALVTTDSSPAQRPDETSRTLLEGLGRAGLLDVNGETPGRATEAVLLVPGVATALEGAVPTPSPSPSPDGTPAWVALASVLDADSAGAVVVGPASSATAGGVLAAVRAQQPLATTVSTVDTGGTPMGDVTTVLALREQQLGSAGSYGFGAGAKAILPTRSTAG